jgi:hypothetical protein
MTLSTIKFTSVNKLNLPHEHFPFEKEEKAFFDQT